MKDGPCKSLALKSSKQDNGSFMELVDQDIVCLTYSDWRASWATPQQIMSRLAKKNRVLYVDQPRSVFYFLKAMDPQGAGAWTGPSLQEVEPNLFVYHMPHAFLPVGKLPLPLAKATLKFNGRLMARMIRQQMAELGMEKPIVFNYSPIHGGAIPHLSAKLNAYLIADEWTNYLPDPAGKGVVNWIDEELTRSADIVFPSTENQFARRSAWNPHMHVVHHAADYGHFSKAAQDATELAPEFDDLPRPVIGAVGVIDPDRFDVALIEHLAKTRPQWSIMLVGPPRKDMDLTRLRQIPGVYLTGNRPIADLPKYLKGFDVCLIPYKVNEATRDIYPLKLQEYLATGKPVVSSAMPSAMAYDAVVEIAEDHDGFVKAIERSLDTDSPEAQASRQAVARENSWEQRVEALSAHVARRLAELEA